jgi:hypothetical protein
MSPAPTPQHTDKPGVKKELAIGDVIRKKLPDPSFIIPIRNDDIAYADAPPEFLRGHIINGHPNWHDCLKEVFEALDEAGVPKNPSPDADALRTIVEAREDGRRFVVMRPEKALTNWFPIQPPQRIRYYHFEGVQEQIKTWLADCRIPTVMMGRLVGAFADPAAFSEASSFAQQAPTAYDLAFEEFVGGVNLGPYLDRTSATNDVVNLLRQHFDAVARSRGLLPVEFATKDIGWFFPDGLLPENRIVFDAPDGRRIRRVMSGKFKDLRWHVCLIAKPRVWPELVYRVHANVVLSADGKTPIPGDKTFGATGCSPPCTFSPMAIPQLPRRPAMKCFTSQLGRFLRTCPFPTTPRTHLCRARRMSKATLSLARRSTTSSATWTNPSPTMKARTANDHPDALH